MPMSDEDSIVQSPRTKPKRRLSRKEKVKKKLSRYDTDAGTSDQSESDGAMSDEGPQELRTTERALKLVNKKLRQSTRHKNLVVRYG